MSHFLGWLLLGWVLVSILATPFVARLVADTLGDDADDRREVPSQEKPVHH